MTAAEKIVCAITAATCGLIFKANGVEVLTLFFVVVAALTIERRLK